LISSISNKRINRYSKSIILKSKIKFISKRRYTLYLVTKHILLCLKGKLFGQMKVQFIGE
jgi:hypothetical protein